MDAGQRASQRPAARSLAMGRAAAGQDLRIAIFISKIPASAMLQRRALSS